MNIDFVYNTDFKLDNEPEISSWIAAFCQTENTSVNSLVFAFFSDEELKSLNIKHLSHDYYTDVISLNQAGIENVVSSSGTSLTEGQIRLIKRFTKNVTILYDGDSAGIKASFRGIDLWRYKILYR